MKFEVLRTNITKTKLQVDLTKMLSDAVEWEAVKLATARRKVSQLMGRVGYHLVTLVGGGG